MNLQFIFLITFFWMAIIFFSNPAIELAQDEFIIIWGTNENQIIVPTHPDKTYDFDIVVDLLGIPD